MLVRLWFQSSILRIDIGSIDYISILHSHEIDWSFGKANTKIPLYQWVAMGNLGLSQTMVCYSAIENTPINTQILQHPIPRNYHQIAILIFFIPNPYLGSNVPTGDMLPTGPLATCVPLWQGIFAIGWVVLGSVRFGFVLFIWNTVGLLWFGIGSILEIEEVIGGRIFIALAEPGCRFPESSVLIQTHLFSRSPCWILSRSLLILLKISLFNSFPSEDFVFRFLLDDVLRHYPGMRILMHPEFDATIPIHLEGKRALWN